MLKKLKTTTKTIMSQLKDRNGKLQMKGFDYYNMHGAGFYDNLLMATIDSQRDDLDSLCQIWSSGTPVERILSCLNNPAENFFKINGGDKIASYAPAT